MKSLWEEIRVFKSFKRTIFIPCDSHDLQLLIKDITEDIEEYDKTIERSNTIVAYFNKSHKQLALFRSHQRHIYKINYALTLAGKIRWGTQYNLLKHLLRTKQALKAYLDDSSNECDNKIIKRDIDSYGFWAGINEFLDVLKPIHETQIISENSEGRLDYVAEK
jgi:hypothetical protein